MPLLPIKQVDLMTFDLLTLKMVSESRVTWATATSMPILVFLGLCSGLRPDMYATDRQTYVKQTDVRQHHRFLPPPISGGA